MIFPEGRIQPPGPLAPLRPGAEWLARSAGVPLVPVAVRVTLRGDRTPAAFMRCGAPCADGDLSTALAAELAQLDADLEEGCPPQGYLTLWRGHRAQQRQTPASRLLTRITGDHL